MRGSRIALLLLALAPAGAAAQEDFTPLLQAKTVMISASFEGGSAENGTGVVLCQDESQAYILTARHVIFGRAVGNGDEPDAGEVNRILVSFYKNAAPAVVEAQDERVITKQSAGRDRDLLLLTVPVQTTLPLTATLGRVPKEVPAGGRGGRVYAVGFEQREMAKAKSWAVTEGALLRRDERHLAHDAPLTPGFSGGPLFDETGALIGINVEIGAEAGTESGFALPIDDVIETVNKWLPGYCLQAVDPVRESAYDTYRRAMRAVSIKKWPEAEALMRAALEDLPWEGGSVHLQGMRYTAYLPRYHLGLALYKQDRCAEAVREWGRSEAQRAIQNDKRYRKLKRHRVRCNESELRKLREAPEAGQEVR